MSNAEKHKSVEVQSTEIKPVKSEIIKPEAQMMADEIRNQGTKEKKDKPKVEREVLIQPLFQEKSFEDSLIEVSVLFLSMLGPVMLVKYSPASSNVSVFAYDFVCAGLFWLTTYLLSKIISKFLEGMNFFVKRDVPRRISASDLRARWKRGSSADFMNAILETRLNVYFLFENNSAKFLKIGFFHSSFFRQKERSNRLFDERCFFDLGEVEEIEQKYPRFSSEEDRVAETEK